MLKKPIGECPVCGQIVEFNNDLSGGQIVHRCCNCFHYVSKEELAKIEEEHHATTATY